MKTITVLVGSIRKESANFRFARALEKLAGSRFRFDYPDLGALPHYNDDLWPNPPAAVLDLKRRAEAADALLFVTPEFNRSVPPILTNALAWGSRPWGHSSWAGKAGAVVGTSPGVIGTAAAQAHLRSILPALDVVLLGQPEVYFQNKPGLIGNEFEITDEGTRAFLEGWVSRFDAFIDRLGPAARKAA